MDVLEAAVMNSRALSRHFPSLDKKLDPQLPPSYWFACRTPQEICLWNQSRCYERSSPKPKYGPLLGVSQAPLFSSIRVNQCLGREKENTAYTSTTAVCCLLTAHVHTLSLGAYFFKKKCNFFLVQSQGILLNVEFLGRSASMKSSAIESFLEKDCLRSWKQSNMRHSSCSKEILTFRDDRF